MADLRRRVEPVLHVARAGLPGQILGRLVEVRFLDRTVILSAQAFSAILPLLIVVATISPCSPRPASPAPCSAATSSPGGCPGRGCGPPGARWP